MNQRARCTGRKIGRVLGRAQVAAFLGIWHAGERSPLEKAMLTLLANSGGHKLQGGKVRATGWSQRQAVYPGCKPHEVYGRSRDDVLKSCLGEPAITRMAHPAPANTLSVGAFDPRSGGIDFTKFFCLLTRGHGLQSFMLFSFLQPNQAWFLLGFCAL